MFARVLRAGVGAWYCALGISVRDKVRNRWDGRSAYGNLGPLLSSLPERQSESAVLYLGAARIGRAGKENKNTAIEAAYLGQSLV